MDLETNGLNIRDLPTEIVLQLVEHIDGISYIEFIIAFGSYELFLATKDGNRERFLESRVHLSKSYKEEYNVRRDTKDRHGKSISYTFSKPNEQLRSIAHYRDGLRHGRCADYDVASEILKFETWYYRGAVNGRSIHYYPNGVMQREQEMVCGRNNGSLIEYYENGNPAIVAVYQNNCPHGIYLKYTEKGELSGKRNYVNGARNGKQIKYYTGCSSQTIFQTTVYQNGVKYGKHKEYSMNGELIKNYRYHYNLLVRIK
jgi:antitoxin component YwqK of YwqJK toxin-antitoxin module